MDPLFGLRHVIRPACQLLGGPRLISDRAEVLLLATALQESGLSHRRQLPLSKGAEPGPARSYLQFEEIAIGDVLTRRTSSVAAARLMGALSYPAWVPDAVHRDAEQNDVLAFGLSRLNFWNDPQPLPDLQEADSAWAELQ